MKKLLSVAVFILFFISASYGQDDKEYSAAIKKMYVVMGTDNTFKIVIKQMISVYKTKYPFENSWNDLEAELTKTSIDDLVEMLIPVYRRHLTITDIEDLTRFYQTPVGQKYVNKLPEILQESMQVGQEWGQKIGKKIEDKLKEKQAPQK